MMAWLARGALLDFLEPQAPLDPLVPKERLASLDNLANLVTLEPWDILERWETPVCQVEMEMMALPESMELWDLWVLWDTLVILASLVSVEDLASLAQLAAWERREDEAGLATLAPWEALDNLALREARDQPESMERGERGVTAAPLDPPACTGLTELQEPKAWQEMEVDGDPLEPRETRDGPDVLEDRACPDLREATVRLDTEVPQGPQDTQAQGAALDHLARWERVDTLDVTGPWAHEETLAMMDLLAPQATLAQWAPQDPQPTLLSGPFPHLRRAMTLTCPWTSLKRTVRMLCLLAWT